MKAGIESSARAERVAASDELQLHENPSTLAAQSSPAKAKRIKRLIAEDERKFPLEVLRRTVIKSVTGVTNGPPDL
jgi:hypothetical protein